MTGVNGTNLSPIVPGASPAVDGGTPVARPSPPTLSPTGLSARQGAVSGGLRPRNSQLPLPQARPQGPRPMGPSLQAAASHIASKPLSQPPSGKAGLGLNKPLPPLPPHAQASGAGRPPLPPRPAGPRPTPSTASAQSTGASAPRPAATGSAQAGAGARPGGPLAPTPQAMSNERPTPQADSLTAADILKQLGQDAQAQIKQQTEAAVAGLMHGMSNVPPTSPPTGEGMPASVAAAGLQLSAEGVAQTKFTGDMSMHDLGEVMKMQMKQQTEMALMKLIVSMNEALAKEIKKTGDAVKNLAG